MLHYIYFNYNVNDMLSTPRKKPIIIISHLGFVSFLVCGNPDQQEDAITFNPSMESCLCFEEAANFAPITSRVSKVCISREPKVLGFKSFSFLEHVATKGKQDSVTSLPLVEKLYSVMAV